MINVLSDTLLAQFGELVATRTALHFPESRWRDLERKACSAAKAFAFDDVEAFARWVVSSPLTSDQMDVLVSCLTVNETYFWREPNSFQVLETKILPELIRAREGNGRRLRLWSAGCSTGEEAYSMAIALHKVLRDTNGWNITILATDINPKMLQKASAGIYGKWSFRNAPAWLTDNYFRLTQDGRREIVPEIRRMVDFAYLNLAEDPYPSALNNTNAMDVIFCRNVLMYFASDYILQVGERLYDALVDGGWLMVSASELSQHSFPKFISVTCEGAIGYQKKVGITQADLAFPLKMNSCKTSADSDMFAATSVVESPVPPTDIPFGDLSLFAKPPGEVDSVTAPTFGFDKDGHIDEIEVAHLAAAVDHPYEGKDATEDDASSSFDAIPSRESSFIVSDLRALANEGRLEEALVLCDDAIAADKMNTGLHYFRAVILQELDQKDEAIASLNRTLYLDSEFILAHFALGNLGLRKGNMRMAKRSFKNVLSLLNTYSEEDILPESEGLTAGRFKEIIQATMQIGILV